MLDRHECELISAGLDGELSPKEQRAHDDLLARSEEARRLRAELFGVGAAIASLPERRPPAGLADKVLAKMAPRDSNVVPLNRGWRRAQVPLAFAAGLLLALVIPRWLPFEAGPGDHGRMSGTLAPATQHLPGSGHVIDTEGLKGSIMLGRRGDTPTLEFRLRAPEPLEVEVVLNDESAAFGGIVPIGTGPAWRDGRLEFTGGTVRVVGDGAAAFGLLLPATAADADGREEIRVAIYSGGRMRYEASFND